jgi:putative membrane protein insertion efficiency factor
MDSENGNEREAEETGPGRDSYWPDGGSRKWGCGRITIIIMAFIIIENLIIPPRYQVSNNMALGLLWVYQNTASKAFKTTGVVRCRFYPTCSEYARLSLMHDGFLVGSVKGIWRVLRCNPLNRGPVEDWPYDGAWDDCRQLPQPHLELPADVHLPRWAYVGDYDDGKAEDAADGADGS